METRITIDIKARPEQVWEVMSDVERWPEWTASMTSVELDGEALALGVSATIKQPSVPSAEWMVTAFEAQHSFTWESRAPGIRSSATHELRDIGAFGTSVTLTVRQEGPLALLMKPWLSHLTQRYINMEAVGLKRRCETPVPAEAMRAAS